MVGTRTRRLPTLARSDMDGQDISYRTDNFYKTTVKNRAWPQRIGSMRGRSVRDGSLQGLVSEAWLVSVQYRYRYYC
jgi:hypothetical protein